MTKIIVDAITRSQLRNLAEVLQFTDEFGTLLGHFTPVPDSLRREPQISEEELDRRERAGGGRPLSDILVDLNQTISTPTSTS